MRSTLVRMMTSKPAAVANSDTPEIDGGPVFGLCKRLGMSPNQPRGALRLALLALLVTWVPMVVLAAIQGLALAGSTSRPLLLDPGVWARIVIALPGLIVLAPAIAARTGLATTELDRLVPGDHRKEFDDAVRGLRRMVASWVPDIVLLALAATTSWVALHAGPLMVTDDWRTLPLTGAPSLARTWSAAVALPIFQFLVMRWGWRIALWWGFLIRVGRLDLELLPTHPDGFAGLGFLGETQASFFPLASPLALIFATYVVMAGARSGEDPRSFEAPGAVFVVLCAVALMGPALSFVGTLIRARRRAIFEYGRLGQSYVSQFDQKWVRGDGQGDTLLGTADIQSLADISNSMKVVRELSIVPFERRHLILFAACIVLPVIPPLLLVMPLREILLRVASIVAR
jgi:hypothetical protein